jgi:hypothetical protein
VTPIKQVRGLRLLDIPFPGIYGPNAIEMKRLVIVGDYSIQITTLRIVFKVAESFTGPDRLRALRSIRVRYMPIGILTIIDNLVRA